MVERKLFRVEEEGCRCRIMAVGGLLGDKS